MPTPHPSSPPIRITDVSPRDGLQNEPKAISAADKADLIHHLLRCRFDEIEVSSFVSAKWVPQLGDAAEVFALITPAINAMGADAPLLSALVPNAQGLAAAFAVNDSANTTSPLIAKVSVFTAASEAFSQRNTNASIAQTLTRFAPVIREAHAQHLLVRGYISCIIACPFEGPISPSAVLDVAKALLDLGVDELDLGDTIGAATADTLAPLLTHLTTASIPFSSPTSPPPLTLHLHDTFGRAGDCVATALAHGITSFDAAVAGLGGCPYASTPGRRAPGNINITTLLNALSLAGRPSRINPAGITDAAHVAQRIVFGA